MLIIRRITGEYRIEEREGRARWVLRYRADPLSVIEVNLDRSNIGADEAKRLVLGALEPVLHSPDEDPVDEIVWALAPVATALAGGPVAVTGSLRVEVSGSCGDTEESCDLEVTASELVEFYPA